MTESANQDSRLGQGNPTYSGDYYAINSVGDLKKDVGILISKVDSLEKNIDSLKSKSSNHDDRLNGIDTKIAWVLGAAATLTALLGVIAFILNKLPWEKMLTGK